MVSPVVEKDYHDNTIDSDQMRYEKYLRSRIAERNLPYPADRDYSSWSYYYEHGESYVDFSTFYSVLTYVRFDAVSILKAEKRMKKSLTVWTYGAISIYLNGKLVLENDTPVYKPIIRKDIDIELEEGDNEIYVILQNLGVRDTRSLFGLELDSFDGIIESVPGEKKDEYERIARYLDSVVLSGSRLVLPYADDNLELGYDLNSPDYGKNDVRFTWKKASCMKEIEIEEGNPYILLRLPIGGSYLKRRFEIASFVQPEYHPGLTWDENFKRLLKVIADAEGLSRGGKFGFYIQNILARKALGIENPRDAEYFDTTLQQIRDRYDCSDFLISGIIRYMKNYEISEDLKKKIDDTLINYRYWMSMKGSDAMCFWSENHSLLFYSSAMLVGAMYPDSYFPRAEMTGKELSAFGRRLAMEWFDDLDEYGFEEFLSTVYMNVTFACLLNIIDYGDEEISRRAVKVTDLMVRELSMHTFDGSIIAPMGRVYRGVIYPSHQGAQSLMNLVNPKTPATYGEGWLSYYATSSYKFPEDLVSLQENPVSTSYSTGDALVRLEKTRSYCLTSVESPRRDGFVRWQNITLSGDASKYENTHLYTKSFNERFHGTTCIEPGVFGYQQHIWSAALSNEAIAFVNNPGGSSDSSSMRPGYWYGNGVMPAVYQEANVLGAIYRIPDSYPIKFTHLYLPECKFDTVETDGNWIFATKEKGYMAIWCSGVLEKYDDQLFDAERRCYDQDAAYLCVMGSEEDDCSFEAFKSKAKALMPSYDGDSTLSLSSKEFVVYSESSDKTQYV